MSTTTSPPTPETDAIILANAGLGPTDYQWREHARRLERERDEARRNAEVERLSGVAVVAMCKRQESEIEAMREAIREVFNSFADEPASDSAWLLDDRQTAALAKLQPFLP